MFDSPTSYSQIFAGFGHQLITDSHGTIRRHQAGTRLSIMANAKRVYDEVNLIHRCINYSRLNFIVFFQALMVKKVKTYLNNADIVTDEKRLEEIANQCEPGRIDRSD